MIDFDAKVILLALARQKEQALKDEYADILAEVKRATALANQLEDELREAARAEFRETGVMNLHDAVTIRLVERNTFPVPDNLALAADYAPRLILLDEKELKRMHKAGEASWAIMRTETVPTPYIKSKLGEYLIALEGETVDL